MLLFYIGGVPRASSSFLPFSGRGPTQSAEREWPREGSETEGRSEWVWRRANEGRAVCICDESAEVESAIGSRKNCMRVFAISFS